MRTGSFGRTGLAAGLLALTLSVQVPGDAPPAAAVPTATIADRVAVVPDLPPTSPLAPVPAEPSTAPVLPEWSLRGAIDLPPSPDPFGATAVRVQSHAASQRWNEAKDKAAADLPALRACLADLAACQGGALPTWRAMMMDAATASPERRLRLVNRGVNLMLTYRSDLAHHGVDEYWAGPLETLADAAGDCEDYALLKLWSLALLGHDPDTMAITVVYDAPRRGHHAILTVAAEGAVLALDSSHAVVAPLSATPYRPVFASGPAGQAVFAPAIQSAGLRGAVD